MRHEEGTDRAMARAFAGLDLLEPRNEGALQVFGLWRTPSSELRYFTMDEALSAKGLEVSEIDEHGSVPEIKVSNTSASMVFLMAGEELLGAKQNRVLNVSLMIPARSAVAVPVSCVEAGRWRYSARGFRSAGTSSHGKLRAKMAKYTARSYRVTGRPGSDQQGVWKEVSEKLDGMSSRSPTEELQQVYKDYGEKLNRFSASLPAPEGCCGVVFAVGGEIAGLDVFDQATTLKKLWPKLLRSYALDALESKPSSGVSREAVQEWLDAAREASSEVHDSPGLGQDLRVESAGVVGGCLLVEDTPVHTELFPARD